MQSRGGVTALLLTQSPGEVPQALIRFLKGSLTLQRGYAGNAELWKGARIA